MATEMVEYRPGRWAKVVDGRIVGRATPEEVAAWLASGRKSSSSPMAPDLDLEVDLSPGPAGGPARTLDVSLRPAFARRGRRPVHEPTPLASPEGPSPAKPAAQAPPSPKERRIAPTGPEAPVAGRKKQSASTVPAEGGTAHREKPAASTTPAEEPPARRSKPRTGSAPTRGKASADQESPASPQPAQEALEEGAEAERRPHYWWIWNAHGQPVASFLSEWVPRYKLKFGSQANTILCHQDDLDAVEACGYTAEVSPLLQPGHFYLGHHDVG